MRLYVKYVDYTSSSFGADREKIAKTVERNWDGDFRVFYLFAQKIARMNSIMCGHAII